MFYKVSDQQSSKGSRLYTVEGDGALRKSQGWEDWKPPQLHVLWVLDWVLDQKKDKGGRVGENHRNSVL